MENNNSGIVAEISLKLLRNDKGERILSVVTEGDFDGFSELSTVLHKTRNQNTKAVALLNSISECIKQLDYNENLNSGIG